MTETIIITALCVAGLFILYFILKLLLVVFIIGAQAQIDEMKNATDTIKDTSE